MYAMEMLEILRKNGVDITITTLYTAGKREGFIAKSGTSYDVDFQKFREWVDEIKSTLNGFEKVKNVALALGISKHRIYRWARMGFISSKKDASGNLLVDVEEVKKHINRKKESVQNGFGL